LSLPVARRVAKLSLNARRAESTRMGELGRRNPPEATPEAGAPAFACDGLSASTDDWLAAPGSATRAETRSEGPELSAAPVALGVVPVTGGGTVLADERAARRRGAARGTGAETALGGATYTRCSDTCRASRRGAATHGLTTPGPSAARTRSAVPTVTPVAVATLATRSIRETSLGRRCMALPVAALSPRQRIAGRAGPQSSTPCQRDCPVYCRAAPMLAARGSSRLERLRRHPRRSR
jgi:hypothetical protein